MMRTVLKMTAAIALLIAPCEHAMARSSGKSQLDGAVQITGLYSGGSTMAELVHRDLMNCYGNTSQQQLAAGVAWPTSNCNGTSPYRSDIEILYVGVGNGFGNSAFRSGDASQFTNGAAATPDAVPVDGTADLGSFFGTGIGSAWIPSAAGPPYPSVSFTAGEQPLTSADIAAYNQNATAAGWGAPIQVPAFVAAIAVPFHPTRGWSENGPMPEGAGASSDVALSTATWCGIFTGAITDWSDVGITADNRGTQLGSGPIIVVYRSDPSETTTIFTNAMTAQCAATNHPVPAGWQSASGNTAGTGNNLYFINVANAGLLPANFVAASGKSAVQAEINATVGATGYLTLDSVKPIDPAGPKAANLQIFATLHSIVHFAAPVPWMATPTMADVKPPSFAKSCGSQIEGCANNTGAWGVTNPAPTGVKAYPIGGFSFVALYSCYRDPAVVDALAGTTAASLGYFRWYFGSSADNHGSVRAILWAHGFALVPSGWISAAKKLIATNSPTRIGIPGQPNTACAHVTGGGA